MIYLDNASTTRMDPRVFDAMIPYLGDMCGNPNSPHALGKQAKEAVEKARKQVADLIGAYPEQIVFTHSATDANHMVFKKLDFDHTSLAAVSAVEHSSVLEAAEELFWRPEDPEDYESVNLTVPVTNTGIVSEKILRDYLGNWDWMRGRGSFASIMLVNNETGAVNDVKRLSQIMHENRWYFFYTDATAAAGAMKIDVKDIDCDFMTFASHKMHGPKGVAALYSKNAYPHEFPYDGTPDVPAIVGFGEACRIQKELIDGNSFGFDADYDKIADVFLAGLTCYISSVFDVNTRKHAEGEHFNRILSLRFPGVDAETLVMLCSERGLMISAGAACESNEKKPSHVLTAMGLTPEEARSSVRVSFSRMTTIEECTEGAEILASCVNDLRELGLRENS